MGEKQLKLDFTTVGAITALTLVIVQAAGLIFKSLNIFLGPIFLVIPMLIAALLGMSIYKKSTSGYMVTKADTFILLFVTALAILAMLFLRSLVPEIFIPSVVQFQSMIGFGG